MLRQLGNTVCYASGQVRSVPTAFYIKLLKIWLTSDSHNVRPPLAHDGLVYFFNNNLKNEVVTLQFNEVLESDVIKISNNFLHKGQGWVDILNSILDVSRII